MGAHYGANRTMNNGCNKVEYRIIYIKSRLTVYTIAYDFPSLVHVHRKEDSVAYLGAWAG